MATIAEIKRELQAYITQAMEIENNNRSLKEKVAFLENQLQETENKLDCERKLNLTKLNLAKTRWRQQALEYGLQQRESCIAECDEAVNDFKTLFLDDKSNRTYSLVSTLIRSKFNEFQYKSSNQIYQALAYSVIRPTILVINDFDTTVKHISIKNLSDHPISVFNYSVKFEKCGLEYKFSIDYNIAPSSSISLWWGKRNSFRACVNIGSFFWDDFEENVEINDDEIADLNDKMHRKLISIHSNQYFNRPDGQIFSTSSVQSKKRDSAMVNHPSNPRPKKQALLSLSNNHAIAETTCSEAVNTTEDCITFDNDDNSESIPKMYLSKLNWESIFLAPMPSPSLFNRHPGPITIHSVDLLSNSTKNVQEKWICISICNHSDKAYDLSGHQLLVVGYPSEYFNFLENTKVASGKAVIITNSKDSKVDCKVPNFTSCRSHMGSSPKFNIEEDESDLKNDGEDLDDIEFVTRSGVKYNKPRSRYSIDYSRSSNAIEIVSPNVSSENLTSDDLDALVSSQGQDYDVNASNLNNVIITSPLDVDIEKDIATTIENQELMIEVLPSPDIIVIEELSSIFQHFPYPRSLHILNENGDNVCEYVESSELKGIFNQGLAHASSLCHDQVNDIENSFQKTNSCCIQ